MGLDDREHPRYPPFTDFGAWQVAKILLLLVGTIAGAIVAAIHASWGYFIALCVAVPLLAFFAYWVAGQKWVRERPDDER